MSIFGRIRDAIFGRKASAAPAPQAAPASGKPAPAPVAVPTPAPMSDVDVMASLSAMPGAEGLNWRSSIVDLMKLVGIDSSFENRKALAGELGNAGYSGSAEDNILLHRQVMRELAANGGRVPADLLD